ncbi:TonB-dependent receptor domain-containing protein [Pararhodobacter sp. CCB-MM2]|uniref:TonB-dependent receptor domain-containing protein n=1 Tax=Pararhodobacter sp. CCB-MM2 TaxID=1786003 RepID=UPI00082C4E23|nr:TonB-dependent receptor [Pararhodobacter sp. CCB-MM2]
MTYPLSLSRPARARLMAGVAALALASGAPQSAGAQEDGGLVQFLGTILLDPAHARARDPEGTAADRGNSHYVADAELERARMGDLRDLFAGIASVSVGGAIPIAQKIFVNGIDMLNLAVTLDGVSQNNRLFHHISANAFDPGLLRFVRVDAGAAPADAGPHAMAGAVVMETVDVGDILEPGQQYGGNARLSFGSNGETFGRSATAAGRIGMLEWLAYARTVTGEDYRAGDGSVVEGSAADLSTRLLKLAFESDDGHRLEFSAQEMQDDALRPYRANIGSVGRPFPLRRHETTRSSYALSYERLDAEGWWDPHLVIGRSEVEVGVDQPYYPALGVSRGVTSTTSATFENRFHFSPDSTLTAGLDFYDRHSTYSDDATAAMSETARNWGIFAQMRMDPSDALSLSFGARWDQQDFTGTNGWQEPFSGFSGNASVSYRVTDALRLRAGISSVFGGMTIEDNFIFNPGWDYTGMRASRSENLTLGFDWEAGDLTLDGEVFITRLSDVRLASYAANAMGDAESRGFNLGLGYGWDNGYLRASYAWSQVDVNGALSDSYSALDLGAPLGGVVSLELQHRPDGSNFTLGGSIDAALAYDDVAAGSDQGLPGYAVLNLFAEYHSPTIRGLTLRAEVNNVFDRHYADRATYGGDFASVTPLYEPGRNVQLTATMRF